MMDGLAFSSIDDDDSNNLDRLFIEEEVCVRGCVKDMVGDKAPGPDGFSMLFFKVVEIWLRSMCWQSFMIFMLVGILREASMLLFLYWSQKKNEGYGM